MAVIETVIIAFWAMLPAYVPNNVAVIAGGGPPIDGGRTIGGKRVLGDGKTWRGTAAGIAAGFVLAMVLSELTTPVSATVGVEQLPNFPPVAALSLPAGAMLGDILASFGKRRTGRERGAMFPLVDQLDFVAVSLPLTALVAFEWFRSVFALEVLLVVVIMTPMLHLLTNGIGYALGLKDEPW